jgi:hypothetical protein
MTYIILKIENSVETYLGSNNEWFSDLPSTVKFSMFEDAERTLKAVQSKYPRDGMVMFCVGTLDQSESGLVERKCYSPRVSHNNFYNSAPYDT